MLIYLHGQPSINPGAAAVTPTPILQANPAWGARTGGVGHRKLQDFEIELFRCVFPSSDAFDSDGSIFVG